jgi:beta-mannosidase
VLLTIDDGWQLARVEPGAADSPDALARAAPGWRPAQVPGTVAAALAAAGDPAPPGEDLDAHDWWYRCRFELPPAEGGERTRLRLAGLATVARVWLNGEPVLSSRNMFVSHAVDVTGLVRLVNELQIRFESLAGVLATRRGHGRWPAPLVEDQRLRWARTTLFGRMPGWTPPVHAVGPWRPVTIERQAADLDVTGIVTSREEGGGRVRVRLEAPVGAAPEARVEVGSTGAAVRWSEHADAARGVADIYVPDADPWWPHTHGPQPLYDATLRYSTQTGGASDPLGRIGFRDVELRTADGGFELAVNGESVFCRGACWAPLDAHALCGTSAGYRAALAAARDAGMNMIRVPGVTLYESDLFYELCDELGILVWQDFMFANMDYPFDDHEFAADAERECRQALARLSARPSVAIACGGSEVEQQAAMIGAPPGVWRRAFFDERLRDLCGALAPNIAYWPATPHGGPFPFACDAGSAHYYGVGAYMRPLSDVRASDVRFAAECLAFANVPDARTLEAALPARERFVHSPGWKRGTPRDAGAGWDFDDVRDHYLELLFGVVPLALRYSDHERYLALSRAITGEVMADVVAEWRRAGSACSGALVWMYRDVVPGAGWGVVAADGRPKPAYHYLRRAFAPIALLLVDEGLNGLRAHVVNDRPDPLEARLALALHRFCGGAPRHARDVELTVAPRSAVEVSVDEAFGGFLDLTQAYGFGPRSHDVVHGSLSDPGGTRLADAFRLPHPRLAPVESRPGLEGTLTRTDGALLLELRAQRFAQAVAIDARELIPDDSHFHLAPGDSRRVLLRGEVPAGRPAIASAWPLNAAQPLRVELEG